MYIHCSLLAVGSLIGEVLLYSCGQDDNCVLSQTVHCGASAITCATWMNNSRCICGCFFTNCIHYYKCNGIRSCTVYTGTCVHFLIQCIYIYCIKGMYVSMHSVLVVGGTDDSIHILQRKQSPVIPTDHHSHTQSSLLSYCESNIMYTWGIY